METLPSSVSEYKKLSDGHAQVARQLVLGVLSLLMLAYVCWRAPEKIDVFIIKVLHVTMVAWLAYFVDLLIFNVADRLYRQTAAVNRVNAWHRRAYIFIGVAIAYTFGIA